MNFSELKSKPKKYSPFTLESLINLNEYDQNKDRINQLLITMKEL
jgi:hypothetical protein